MNLSRHMPRKKLLCLTLAATTVVGSSFPAAAAEAIGNNVSPSYDEAYYATLDYYGNLLNGSVVKSYTLNGATSLTDHGDYDEINNLTDSRNPITTDHQTTFEFDDQNAPAHFYFEGKTAAPFEALPWTISVSYTLNGVPTPAEDLAGKTGVVEIIIDAVPNEAASEYARYNYTLEATAMFNQDDILSLEAEGAQVQLIGNIRAVLFAVLPGETCHRVIRVGSDDFSFDGMTFILVPATLGQLEEISKLSQRKDDLEEDYRKLSGSLDELLSSFSSLGGSLRETAVGLDQLNEARDTISQGKDQIYDDGDKVLADLKKLNGSLNTLPGHLESADGAVEDVTDSLDDVNDAAGKLQGELDDLDRCIRAVQTDLNNIRTHNGPLKQNLDQLGKDVVELKQAVKDTKEAIAGLDLKVNGGIVHDLDEKLDKDDKIKQHISIKGQNAKALKQQLTAAEPMQAAWKALAVDQEGKPVKEIPYMDYLAAVLKTSAPSKSAAEVKKAVTLFSAVPEAAKQAGITVIDEHTAPVIIKGILMSKQGGEHPAPEADGLAAAYTPEYLKFQASKPAMDSTYHAVTQTTGTDFSKSVTQPQFYVAGQMLQKIQEIQSSNIPEEGKSEEVKQVLTDPEKRKGYEENAKTLIALESTHEISKPVAGLMQKLEILLDHLGDKGLTGHLSILVGDLTKALGSLDDTADEGRDILKRLDTILGELDGLNDSIQTQVPGLKDTIQDTRTLVTDMVLSVDDTHAFLTSVRSLAKNSGDKLDEGTRKSLENLSETLRRTANSTDAVGGVKTAKDAVSEIVEDTWHEYTGDINNMLMMDPTAEAQSLTSSENPAPASIQVLIRTQEIKVDEEKAAKLQPAPAKPLTFWGRIGKMFKDMWSTVTGIFH